MTTSVDRHDPRNSRIISAVRPAAIAPSRSTPATDCFTNTDWSNSSLICMPGGAAARAVSQRLVHGIDDAQRRGVAVLDDAEQHRAAAVLPHHVLLHQPAVMNLADVLDEDRGPIDDLDRNIVEIVDGRGRGVGPDGILRAAEFCRARRQRQVLRVDGVDDVERRKSLGEQLRGVQIDHDLAIFSAGRRRQRDAGNWRQLLADPIDAVVVELLFVERVGTQADLQHRHA